MTLTDDMRIKKTINGTRYDTQTATYIGVWDNQDLDPDVRTTGDPRFERTGLFCTKRSRRYFLAGWGGAWSMWNERKDRGLDSGSGVRPISQEEAIQWGRKHLSEELLLAHWPLTTLVEEYIHQLEDGVWIVAHQSDGRWQSYVIERDGKDYAYAGDLEELRGHVREYKRKSSAVKAAASAYLGLD